MSTQATASAQAQPGYDAFSPQPLRNVTAQRMADEQGPKCTRCKLPSKLAGDPGGCTCPRFWSPDGTDATLVICKTLEERRVEALEESAWATGELVSLLRAFASNMKVEVPAPAPRPTAAVATPLPAVGAGPSPAAVEAIRHAEQQRRKVS